MCGLIYTTMECEDTQKKPELSFKLVSVMKYLPGMCLQNQKEWQDLIRAVEKVEMKGGMLLKILWLVKRMSFAITVPQQTNSQLVPSCTGTASQGHEG